MDGEEVVDGIQIVRFGGFVQGVIFGVERCRIVIVRSRLVGGNGEQDGGKGNRRDSGQASEDKIRHGAQKEDADDENVGSPAVVLA